MIEISASIPVLFPTIAQVRQPARRESAGNRPIFKLFQRRSGTIWPNRCATPHLLPLFNYGDGVENPRKPDGFLAVFSLPQAKPAAP